MQVSAPWLICSGLGFAGVGYTLLTYSKDGDLELRTKSALNRYSDPTKSSDNDAWQRLLALANASATEVTWNTSLFVAFASGLVFLGLIAHARGPHVASLPPNDTAILWILAVFTVFGLQDAVQRWKSAHRKHALASEQISIIERLRQSPKLR
jgi:hypothetical protein